MNPFRKRSKSSGDIKKNNNRNKLPGNPQIIPSLDIAFSLPSENAFRTSLLMPKMADRFSLLRVDEQGQHQQAQQRPPEPDGEGAHVMENGFHVHQHNRDLSILEEGDEEEEEELPVRPWNRHDGHGAGGKKKLHGLRDGMSKDEFIRVRAQEGHSVMFSGKQRTFKIKSEDGNDTDRQYSSSSLSSKSPHSPAFEYRPSSSHTSTTSSIIFSSSKPPPINTKLSNPLGFDFGLSVPITNQVPPSPTSTVYEVIDSPTLPDFLTAEDGSTTVSLVRNHLRSPSDAQPTANLRDSRFSFERGKLSAEYARNYASNEYDRDSVFGDDSSGVLGYYGQDDHDDERESTVKPPRKSTESQKPSKRTSPNHPRLSLFDDLAPVKPSLNVTTNVTIVPPPSPATPAKSPLRSRQSEISNLTSPKSPTSGVHPIDLSSLPNGSAVGHGYDAPLKSPTLKSPTFTSPIHEDDRRETKLSKRSRSGSVATRSRSNSEARRITPITTDIRYITPEMPSMAVFPNTPPPSVSPNSAMHPVAPMPGSLTPPLTVSERTVPSSNVIKALKDKNISEPHFISMTTSVPTIPIIKMDDTKLSALRNERRKANRSFRARKPMLEDETDDGPSRAVSPNPFARRKTSSPPGMATRRRETTAGSVLFDEGRDELLAGPEYTTQLPSPFAMEDTPYIAKSRHRRKVSRTECDPQNTMSSPAVMHTWDSHPKNDRRRMDGAIDPAW